MRIDRHQLKPLLVLVVLGLILVGIALLLWGRLLLKQVPQAAVADQPVKAAATPPASDHPSMRAGPRPVVFVDLPDKIRRDVFTIDPSRYEVIEPAQIDDSSQILATETDRH